MERKFESELAKHLAEGKRRRASKPLGLAIMAFAVMAMFAGAAAFSLATTAKASLSPVMDDQVLLDAQTDQILVTENDEAAKRVVNLKYRSVTPPGDGDLGTFKFTYAVNLMIKADGSGITAGDAIGNLNIVFDGDLNDYMVTISATATVVDQLGVSSGYTPVVMDDADELNVIDVTAAIPMIYELDGETPLVLLPGYSVSITIMIDIDDSPGLSGSFSEQPFPTAHTTDVDGEIVYDFEARSGTFPIVEEVVEG